MHARLDRYNGQSGHRVDSPDLADLSIGVAGQPGLLSCLTFRQLGGPATVCLTLWDTEASVTGCPGADAGLAPPASEIYQVTDAEEGLAATQVPTYARLMCFDGPRAPEQAAAEELAVRHRPPATIPGTSDRRAPDTKAPAKEGHR
jgi:hypothetical protein